MDSCDERSPRRPKQITLIWDALFLRAEEEQDTLFAILDEAIERRAEELKEVEMTGAEALIRKGREEGRTEGQRELLKEQLEARFGPLPDISVRKLTALTDPQLKSVARQLMTASSLGELGLDAA